MKKTEKTIFQKFLTISVSLCLVMSVCIFATGCSDKGDDYNNAKVYKNLTYQQEQRIRYAVFDALTKASEDDNDSLLESRATGAALTLRRAQTELQSKSDEIKSHMELAYNAMSIAIPEEESWPRTFVEITSTSDNQESEKIVFFTQNSPTNNYKASSIIRTFSQTQIPAFGDKDIDSENESDLKLTPKAALTQYADVLQNGDKSQYAGTFGSDDLRTSIQNVTDTVGKELKENGGSQTQTFTLIANTILGIKTADGGALVVGEIDSDWTRTTSDDHFSRPIDVLEETLLGRQSVTSSITAKYLNLIALYIPAANSSDSVRTLGAERIPISVTPN